MTEHDISFDDYASADIAKKVEAAAVKKASLPFWSVVFLSIIAGSFIGIGGMFSTLVTFDSNLPLGITKLLGGLVFCVGLILVVVAGAELFTGNNLIVMGVASRVVRFSQLLRNWAIVYTGNLIGSLAAAFLMYYTNLWKMGSYGYAAKAVIIAAEKTNLTFVEGITRGILCNALVCLAIWMCFGARQIISKIAAIIFPVTAFVAIGFEHSIANMYFIPFGLILKNNPNVIESAAKMSASLNLSNLTIYGFLGNLLSVTLGNIVGGAIMIGLIYWIIIVVPQKRKR
ncbi:MAG: formate/nitrite transporter family protein [Actinomycetota bacterium]|nr:formate/nitrite transporter family protein [Actinomycetota bacterium]